MPHSFGKRARTRDMFAREFRQSGQLAGKVYMTVYKVGDLVDIKGCGAVQKGMPYKFYHGKTGRVFNVTPRGLGVEVNKYVNGRIIAKRINIRFEHVKKSRSREAFVERCKVNDELKHEAKKAGKKLSTKRQIGVPKKGYICYAKGRKPELLEAVAFEELA